MSALGKNVMANYVGAVVTALMTIAFVPLYIRYLGIEAYGLIGVFALLQGCLSLLDLGIAPALSREFAQDDSAPGAIGRLRDLLRSAEILVACVAATMGLLSWATSNWLAVHWLMAASLAPADVAQAFAIMGSIIGLRVVENIYRSVLIGRQQQVRLNLVVTLMATLRGAGAALVLTQFSSTIQAYFCWQLMVSVVSVAAFCGMAYSVLPSAPQSARFSLAALRNTWRFAAGALAIAVLSVALTHVDKLLLSRLLTLQAFGLYSFAVVVAQTPLGLVGPIAQASFPRFVQLWSLGRSEELTRLYHTSAQLVTVLLGSVTVMLVVFGRAALAVWTQDASLSAQTYSIAAVLALGSLMNGLMTIPYYLQMSSGWTGLSVRANLIALLIVVPALWLLVPAYGPIGAAWVWFGLNAGYLVVVVPIMHRRLLAGEQGGWYVQDVILPLLAATGVAVLLRAVAPDFSGRIAQAVLLLAIGALVLVAAALSASQIRAACLAKLRRAAAI